MWYDHFSYTSYHGNTGTIEECTCLAAHYLLFHLKDSDDRNNDVYIHHEQKKLYH